MSESEQHEVSSIIFSSDSSIISNEESKDDTQPPAGSDLTFEVWDRIQTAKNMATYLSLLTDSNSVSEPVNSLVNDIKNLTEDPGVSDKTVRWMSECDRIMNVLDNNDHTQRRSLALVPVALKGVLSAGNLSEEARLSVWKWRNACAKEHTDLLKEGQHDAWDLSDSDSDNGAALFCAQYLH